MRLGFHTKQLTERGTEIALFDYALAARDLLGHEVSVYVPASTKRIVPFVRRRFEESFEVVLYSTPRSISCDALYVIKKGQAGRVTDSIPELNHAFADASRPHGHRFAVVSSWLARTAVHGLRLPGRRTVTVRKLRRPDVVPHIVSLPEIRGDFRDELGIPDEGVVFGRHGGHGTFCIDFVTAAIRAALAERSDIWFLFVSVPRFVQDERVIHLPALETRADTRRFVNTCDYMLHATPYGETFGLAVAEFAFVGAPVLTFLGAPQTAHLDLLSKDLLLGYACYEDVLWYLRNLQRRTAPVESDVAERYSAERVMTRFDEVFLH